MIIKNEVIGIWDIRFFPEYGRIHISRKLRTPIGSRNWELVEDLHDQTKADYERIVEETREKWGK